MTKEVAELVEQGNFPGGLFLRLMIIEGFKAKKLLYCSLYPEDYDIPRDELIANFISEELMHTRLSRRAEYDQGHAILNKLEKACLVEIWNDREVVRMHDLIRDMALTITKHNPRYMVKAGLELTGNTKYTELDRRFG
ncbi:Disease resistance protein RFL1 [Abeliophyllum distichum]|uniref:Disease resistance protein RFL1 n=1 Tax=Abeliophyllum distichum TaxID=126358 RepID=A0ABD1T0Y4_9LAMI